MLNRAMEKSPGSKQAVISGSLQRRIDKLRAILPDQFKSQAERFIHTAMLYFNRQPDLKDCPPQDFLFAVFEGARLGLAIDGKLGYVVRYKSKYQFQADYKGLLAVARRAGVIEDAHLELICENDNYLHQHQGEEINFFHEKPTRMGPRGEVLGAFCKLIFPPGKTQKFKVIDMDKGELEAIRRRAPSKSGPWATDTTEMYKKTVCRRALKLYAEDPAIAQLIDAEDQFYEEMAAEEQANKPALPPVGRDNLLRKPAMPVPEPEPIQDETPPEPSREESESMMAQADTRDDLMEQIGNIESQADAEEVLRKIAQNEEVLGPLLAQQLRDQVAAKRK